MRVTVLDGGFSTQLSHYVGDVIDGDPLWSARYLSTNPEAVLQVHLDFLNAGAEVIITNSYQASISGFIEYLGLDRNASLNLIRESARLAQRAREAYLKENPTARRPLIAGSIGPFGASLHDGSEYSGSYIQKYSTDTILDWHRPRIAALIEAGVDLLAIETIPAKAEAEALLKLIKEFPGQKAWLTFQCKDSQHIADGESFAEVVKSCWELNKEQLVGLGCNCVNPNYVTGLFQSVRESGLAEVPLVVYPNSGEQYTPDGGWFGKGECASLSEFVDEWLDLGVKYIGGCCRTEAKDVEEIKKGVKKWMLKHK